MSHIIEQDKQYVANTYARFPLAIVKGEGSWAYDENGKKYIDMGTGIAVNTFGYSDKEWIEAVTAQLNTFQHTSNLYYTEPCVKLAQMLCERTGMKKVFFSNSGAEANECAIKTARKYGETNKGKDCYKIITIDGSFHGRTVTTLAATGQESMHKDFLPLTEGFSYIEPTKEALMEAVDDNTCAIMFEIVRGEGGVAPLTEEFLMAVKEVAAAKNILIVVDEVQCGNGRTGKLYGYMNYDITPDIVSTAKGLAGGLPLGATLLGEKVENILGAGMHGSTFGGNPVCCSGAVNILSRLDDQLMAEVCEKSKYIFDTLAGKPGIKSVTGLGLMIGIETEKPCGDVLKYCMEHGVLVLTAKTKVRLLPALNIPFEELKKAIDVIIEGCAPN